MTTVTFRTDSDVKEKASEIFAKLGMNLSVAINMFLRQAIREQKYPCALELDIAEDAKGTYPKDFFSLFGAGKNLKLAEPRDFSIQTDRLLESL